MHPNAVVAPIHPKAMPVLQLDELARETWLLAQPWQRRHSSGGRPMMQSAAKTERKINL